MCSILSILLIYKEKQTEKKKLKKYKKYDSRVCVYKITCEC